MLNIILKLITILSSFDSFSLTEWSKKLGNKTKAPSLGLIPFTCAFKKFGDFTLGYEYAQINGIGLGFEYQFYRSLSDTDFGYNSFYLIYNFTLPERGLSLFVRGGVSSLRGATNEVCVVYYSG